MTSRYTGTIGRRLEGNLPRAHEVQGTARLLVQQCIDHINHNGGWGQMSRQIALRDGTIVKAIVLKHIRGFEPIVRVEIFAPQGGEAQVQITQDFGGFLINPSFGGAHWVQAFLRTVKYPSRLTTTASALWREPERLVPPDLVVAPTIGAGPVSWCGRMVIDDTLNESVVSYDHGLSTRYRLYPHQDCSGRLLRMQGEFPVFAQSGAPGVWWNGRNWPTVYEISPATYHADGTVHTPAKTLTFNVVGAAACGPFLVAVSHVDVSYEDDPERTPLENALAKSAANSVKATVFYAKPGAPWRIAGENTYDFFLKAPWFFNRTGTLAASIKDINNSSQSRLNIRLIYAEGAVSASFDSPIVYSDSVSAHYEAEADGTGTDRWSKWLNELELSPAKWVYQVGDSVVDFDGDVGAIVEACPDSEGKNCSSEQLVDGMWESLGGFLGIRGSCAPIGGGPLSCIVPVGFWRSFLRRKWYEGGVDTIWNRGIRGKRYIAIDFDPNGQELALTLELEKVGGDLTYKTKYWDEWWDVGCASGYMQVTYLGSPLGQGASIHLEGGVRWILKAGNSELVSAFGGVKDGGSAKRSRREIPGLDCDGGVSLKYTANTPPFITERIWVMDVDIRTKSCIYEKHSIEYTIDNSEEVLERRGIDLFELKAEKHTASYHVVSDGYEVYSHERDPGVMGGEFHGETAHVQLLPRFYGLPDLVEELQLPVAASYVDGPFSVRTMDRRWRLTVGLIPFDQRPHRFMPCEIQSRSGDVVVSGYDRCARMYDLLYGKTVENYPATYVSYAKIDGTGLNIKGLTTSIVPADLDTPDPYYAAPIYTV